MYSEKQWHIKQCEICALALLASKTLTNTHTYLEPLRHICRTDLIVLVSHVTAFQLAWLIDLEDALPPLPPLSLLLWSVPTLFILVLLLLLTLVISIGIKVSKVKVPTKDFLGLLKGSVRGETMKREETVIMCFTLCLKAVWRVYCLIVPIWRIRLYFSFTESFYIKGNKK